MPDDKYAALREFAESSKIVEGDSLIAKVSKNLGGDLDALLAERDALELQRNQLLSIKAESVKTAADNLALVQRLNQLTTDRPVALTEKGAIKMPSRDCLQEMELMGESFIRALCDCYLRADDNNSRRLVLAFGDWFHIYEGKARWRAEQEAKAGDAK